MQHEVVLFSHYSKSTCYLYFTVMHLKYEWVLMDYFQAIIFQDSSKHNVLDSLLVIHTFYQQTSATFLTMAVLEL